VKVYVVLGQIAYHALWSHLRRADVDLPRPRPPFAHGSEVVLDGVAVVMSYHVSQQNTFTGRLTEEMLDAVFSAAVAIAGTATR
jgi:uracil-DNA glycosylase